MESRMGQSRNGAAKPSCEDCFFHQNQLCAVEVTGPCGTFRPAHPDGLRLGYLTSEDAGYTQGKSP